MNIGVVVVTYNRLDKLRHSLDCYANQTCLPQYILVVNNHSSDGTYDFLETWKNDTSIPFEKIVIHLSENTGGSGGFFEGMNRAVTLDADWIWFADDDAYPRNNAFEKLIQYYDSLNDREAADVAAICSAVYNNGKPHYGHRNRLVVTKFKFSIIKSEENDYKKDFFDFDILSYVGSCIKKTVLQNAGFVDKDYFIYRDDQEHSLRIRKYGKLICVTSSIVDHDTPPYDEKEINWGKYYFIRNEYLLIKKHYPYRYFLLRIIKRFITKGSFLSRSDKRFRKIYRAACIDAFLNKKGVHKIYKPGWKA